MMQTLSLKKVQSLIDATPKTIERMKIIENGDGTRTIIVLPPSSAEGFYKGVEAVQAKPGTIGLQVAEPADVRFNSETIDGLRFLLPKY